MPYHVTDDAGHAILSAASLEDLAERVRGRVALGRLLAAAVYRVAEDSGLVRLRARGADLAEWVEGVRATGVWPLDPDEPLRSEKGLAEQPAFDGSLAWHPQFAAMD